MATIKHYKEDALISGEYTLHEGVQSVGQWLVDNIEQGKAFTVYSGEPCTESAVELKPEVLAILPDGDYVILNTPASGVEIALVVALVVSVAVIALTPKPNLPQNVNRQQESPNNSLSSRSNRARPLQRVPDIKGQVLSIPDVAMPTYTTYRGGDGIEIEHAAYCIGRKTYQIEDLKDGDTPIELIGGAGAAIYLPFSTPNDEAPSQIVGSEITEKIVTPFRVNQINGVDLPADFANSRILSQDLEVVDFFGAFAIQGPFSPDEYEVGKSAVLTNFIVGATDYSGTYTIISNTAGFLRLSATLGDTGFADAGGDMSLDGADIDEFTDWAYFTRDKAESLIINVVAPSGLYKDDGSADLFPRTVEYKFELQEVDDTSSPIGAVTTLISSITGDSQKKIGATTRHNFTAAMKFRVRGSRITQRDATFSGTVVDNIQWDDLFAIKNIPNGHTFGDVTIIQTKTQATPFATAVKERQLNCIATEMLNVYQGSGVFAPALTTNKNAIQSFIKDSIDPVIGNRTLSEIDADGLLAIDAEITAYFGTTDNNQFSYTYDSTEISYQDYAQQALNAINCIGYRDGSVIKARFERPVSSPAMLFTHRSKIPGSERYTRNFNRSELNDGIEFNWVDPSTNTTETIFLPANKSAVNPKQLNIPGIRNKKQAIIRSAREFNKIQLQKLTLDVSVTAEGRYVIPSDVIAVVKGSRVYTEDGEILAQDGLTLTLSQNVVFVMGDIHSITLKNDDGTTENIIVSAGTEDNQVLMGTAPATVIRTGIDSRRTEFSFGNDARNEAQLWLAQEIDLTDKLQAGLKAINYELGYYSGDGVNLSAFSSGFSEGFG